MILDGVVSSSVGLWKGISFPWRRPREERRLLMYFDAALRSRGSMTVVWGGGGGLEGVFVHEGEEEEKEEGGRGKICFLLAAAHDVELIGEAFKTN